MIVRTYRSGDPAAVDAAVALALAAAREGSGIAENSIQFCAGLGRVDEAFALADAYFFGRGFHVSDQRFSREQGAFSTLENRRTYILFMPSTAAMRSDRRFAGLVEDLGLARYWREARVLPDFQRGG